MRHSFLALAALCLCVALGSPLFAQIARPVAASAGQQALALAQSEGKFTFLVFYRENDAATQAVAATLQDGIARAPQRATAVYMAVNDRREAALVAQFAVGRAPMPMTIAVAPNGAITGTYSQRLPETAFDEALVTPAMTHCMKGMQDGKLVVLCAHPASVTAEPAVLRDLRADPHFNKRLAVVPVRIGDPAEARFLQELECPPSARSTLVVFMAPPGVLVGRYNASVTKQQMAADLHKAGKCCDDPACQHNR